MTFAIEIEKNTLHNLQPVGQVAFLREERMTFAVNPLLWQCSQFELMKNQVGKHACRPNLLKLRNGLSEEHKQYLSIDYKNIALTPVQ